VLVTAAVIAATAAAHPTKAEARACGRTALRQGALPGGHIARIGPLRTMAAGRFRWVVLRAGKRRADLGCATWGAFAIKYRR
jgi:hypothetical protein